MASSASVSYKEQIKPMNDASETLFTLKPVTFRHKKEIDQSQNLEYGLLAEEVAKI
jgi:endosialidase-like protein